MNKGDKIQPGKGTMKNDKSLQISDKNQCKKILKPKNMKGNLAKIDRKDFTTEPCKTATEECGMGVTIRVASHTVDDSPDTEIKDISNIYVNRGPGSFAGIRNSLYITKAIHLARKIDYYCYSFQDFIGIKKIKYENIPILCDKFKVKKNLIKPIYIS